MDQSLSELKSLGLPIHITELDVNSAAGGQRNTEADIGANAAATEGGLRSPRPTKSLPMLTPVFSAPFLSTVTP